MGLVEGLIPFVGIQTVILLLPFEEAQEVVEERGIARALSLLPIMKGDAFGESQGPVISGRLVLGLPVFGAGLPGRKGGNHVGQVRQMGAGDQQEGEKGDDDENDHGERNR